MADYRGYGADELVCCASDGSVRGYVTTAVAGSANSEKISQLVAERQSLLAELKNYENNLQLMKEGKLKAGAVPPDTRVDHSLTRNSELSSFVLIVSTNNDTVIKTALLFCDDIFEDESIMVHPPSPQSSISIPFRPAKHAVSRVHVKVIVGHRSSVQDHVFEIDVNIPRFATFVLQNAQSTLPQSKVCFNIRERINRVALWVASSFGVSERELNSVNGDVEARFRSVKDGSTLVISAQTGGRIAVSPGVLLSLMLSTSPVSFSHFLLLLFITTSHFFCCFSY